MKFHYSNLETCHTATGFVIVIDLTRAFTNAAFAFSTGVKEIYPVGTVEEALQFKAKKPNTLACGEVGGIPPEGFDFGNSPSQVLNMDLQRKAVVQRTGAGTQGVVRSVHAGCVVAASFVVVGATVKYIQKLAPECITFVVTGQTFSEGGDEDPACAEYLEKLLKVEKPDAASFLERVRNSADATVFCDPTTPEFPIVDMDHCTGIDKFDFAMPVKKENERNVMRAVKS